MSTTALTGVDMIEVNRSELRQNQSKFLRRARGKKVLLIKANDKTEEKVILDKQYFDQIRRNLEAVVETLEIAMDRKLFNQILAAADSLEEDLRLGKLHSLEDAFAED
jgi:predicted Ser/Thr protein kinase